MRLYKQSLKSILVFTCFSLVASSGYCEEAEISGETYLGVSGATVTIRLHGQFCEIRSTSDDGVKNFRIVLVCDGTAQVLWDINNLDPKGLSYDEPKFELLWAGDLDNDYKIDLKMDMSPKYSCTKETVYLSSLGKNGELVGIKGKPEYKCC